MQLYSFKKYYKIDICTLFATCKYTALRSKSKECPAQDDVSEWRNISTWALLFQ